MTNYGQAREDTGFRFSDPRIGLGGQFVFGSKGVGASASGEATPLLGAFYGGELAGLRLDPPTDLVAASYDGRTVVLRAAKDGTSAPTRVVGKTAKGHEFSTDQFVFVTDSTPPQIKIESPAQGSWFNAKTLVAGKAVDAGGPAALSWRRLPDGASSPGELKSDGSFAIALSAADLPAGAFSLELEAKDAAGNVSRAYVSLGADAQAPAVRFLSPEAGASVWGPEDVAAQIDDASGVASVEYAADGKSFAAIEWNGRYFAHRADLAANPKAAYRIVDRAGNAAVSRPEVAIGPAPVRVPAAASLSVESAAGEARIELAGNAGSVKASLLLPGLSDADYAALGDPGAAPPARFATRLLVQGTLSLKGQATVDGQVKAVSLSVDDGATYRLLGSNKDAKSAKASLPFAFAIEAAKLQAGPARWAIKVEDFSGASYTCPLYVLVDAKAPSLAAIYPDKGTLAMPGPFPLVLKAEDENGLASGELASGSGSGAAKEALGVEAGGRYFARMIDPSAGAKGGASGASLSVQAKDPAGNEAAMSLKVAYDAAGDAPIIRLDAPGADAKGLIAPLEAGALVLGASTDDDGAPSLTASIDGGEAIAFPSGSFAFGLPPLPVGKHSLVLQAADSSSGATKLTREFSVKGPGPALGDFTIGDAKSPAPWMPGADFALGPGALVGGNAYAPNGIASVTVAVNGGAPVQASLGKAAGGAVPFSAPIPATLPYERLSLEIAAKDSIGLTSLARLELHKILPSASGIDDAEGIRFADSRIAEAEGKASFLIAPGDKLVGRFNGRPIKSVSIEPPNAALKASFEGTSVAIEGAAEGLVASASLSLVTVDGDPYSWGPFSAAIDSSPPSLELTAPSDGEWRRGEVKVAGKAADPLGIALLQVSVNGGEAVPLYDAAAAKGGKEAAFDRALSLAQAPDGATRLDFLARDGAGREARVTRYINKDTLPPTLTQVEPAPGERVNGLTTFVAEAQDAGRLATVSFLPAPAAKGEDVAGLGTFARDLDLARLDLPLPEGGGFAVTDKAGNQAVLAPSVVVDKEADKPVVDIQAPSEMEVLRGDFVISGVAYDDDGLAAAYYRQDGGPWTRLEMQGTSFSVPVALKDTTDNEHIVEVKAEDIYGVQGDVVSRKYRISKEEPVAVMTGPPISKPVRGRVTLQGTAADANGIKEITVSVDNRASYDRPVGTEKWSIVLDTATLSDGIHAVAVRPVDGYETEGFYASMVSVDNSPPKSQLDLPRDGDEAAGTLSVSGRVSDNIAIASSRIEVAPIGAGQPPLLVMELGTDKIVQRAIDLAALKPGAYTVRLIVRDRADNEALASRDITVAGAAPADSVSIVFPVEGERPSGRLRVQGRARVAAGPGQVTILADGTAIGTADPDDLGWYSMDVPAGALSDGPHVLKARTAGAEGRAIESPDTRVEWSALGPWISIDSMPSGKYVPYRPVLKGKAGWAAEPPPEGDKKALEAYNKAAKARAVQSVELSLDDGRSFLPAKGSSAWSFKLETQEYKEGALHVIVRARYADGSTASEKGLFFLDKTPPEIEVLTPAEGGRFNQVLALSGRAYDLNGLESVGIALRKGDKASYEVPSFIQGLYLDGQMLGATDWQAGIGLAFFQDNVKLQGLYGKAPDTDLSGSPQSFYGDVFGAKLIANILYLPFNTLFGPDWGFLSTSLGVGANFTYFTKTQAGSGLLVGSVFGQLEFPKITLSGLGAFKKFSLYSEFQLWVLSSVVSGGFIPKASFGARIGVF